MTFKPTLGTCEAHDGKHQQHDTCRNWAEPAAQQECEFCEKRTHPLMWHKGKLVHHRFGKSGYYPCARQSEPAPTPSREKVKPYVIGVIPWRASGPGWANQGVNVIKDDRQGKIFIECLYLKDHPQLHDAWHVGIAANSILLREVEKLAEATPSHQTVAQKIVELFSSFARPKDSTNLSAFDKVLLAVDEWVEASALGTKEE